MCSCPDHHTALLCTDAYPHAYLTAAAAIGTTLEEVRELEQRLDKCFAEFKRKRGRGALKN
jgi:hypothetical protein